MSTDWAAVLVSVAGIVLSVPGFKVPQRRGRTSGSGAPPRTPSVISRSEPQRESSLTVEYTPVVTSVDRFSLLRTASRRLAVVTLSCPTLTLLFAWLNLATSQSGAQPPRFNILWAALTALGFVAVMVPLVILVADGRGRAVTAASVICAVVGFVSVVATMAFLLAIVAVMLQAVGVALRGWVFTGSPWLIVVFAAIPFTVASLVSWASLSAHAMLVAAKTSVRRNSRGSGDGIGHHRR